MLEGSRKQQRILSFYHDQSGMVAVIVAILLAVLLGFAALAVDIGHVMVVRNEIQNAADAAALAGACVLLPADPYRCGLSPASQLGHGDNPGNQRHRT